MIRLHAVIATALLSFGVFLAGAALAASPPVAFDQAAFDAARAQGKTIVVETYADWCLPCRIQAPILNDLRGRAPYDNVVVMRIGERTHERVWRQFRLIGYGNLVVFKGRAEVARGTPTTRAAVAALLRQGL